MISIPTLQTLPADVAVHLVAAVCAIALGPVALYRRRRDVWHKITGYAWVTAMAVTAGSALWLHAQVLPIIAGFGPIHLLSIWVLYILYRGVQAARLGKIADHQSQMRGLYWTGLIVTGLLTFLPGRTLNRVFFPQTPELAYLLIASGVGLIGIVVMRRAAVRMGRG